jgi:hypothetical protein
VSNVQVVDRHFDETTKAQGEGENAGEIVIKEEPITSTTTGDANANEKAPNVSYVADTYIMTKEDDDLLL